MIFRLLFQSDYRSRFWKIFLFDQDIFLSVAAASTSKNRCYGLNSYLFDPNLISCIHLENDSYYKLVRDCCMGVPSYGMKSGASFSSNCININALVSGWRINFRPNKKIIRKKSMELWWNLYWANFSFWACFSWLYWFFGFICSL